MAKNKDYSVKVEDLSNVKKELTITVSADVVTKELKAAFKEANSNAAIPGFRKGSVPKHVLKSRFGDQINQDVTTRLIQNSYGPALQEHEYAPLGNPDIDVKDNEPEEGKDFTYTATIELNPKTEIKGYKGLELKPESTEVSDEEVEEGLKKLQESKGDFATVERAADEGDLVELDFVPYVDGKLAGNLRGDNFPVIIGQMSPIPGVDDSVKGLANGDKTEVTLKIPDNYYEKDFAGKDALFKIKVNSVKALQLPDLDDEFAKDLEADSLDELRKKVRADLEKVKNDNERERLKNLALTTLMEKHEIDVPESLHNRYLSMIVNRAIENIRSGKPSPGDEHLTPEQLKEKYAPVATRSVVEDVILDSIAEQEGVEVSTEEMEQAIRSLAAQREVSYEQLLGRIQREGASQVITDGLRHEKVFDIILSESKGAKKWALKDTRKDSGGKKEEKKAAKKETKSSTRKTAKKKEEEEGGS